MIRRAPRPTHSFVVIRNEVARDSRLSYRARGLLVAILSRPDNWTVRAEALAVEGLEGRDAIRTALTELEAAGYLQRTKLQDGDGKWYWESMVFDMPQPETGNPSSDNQGLENRPTDSQASLEEQTRTTEKKVAPEGVSEVFSEWLLLTRRNPYSTRLDNRRRRRIEWALENYSREEITRALAGLKASAWHQGHNSEGKKHDEITLLFRDSATFERFRDSAPDRTPTASTEVLTIREYCGKCQDGYIVSNGVVGFCECVRL